MTSAHGGGIFCSAGPTDYRTQLTKRRDTFAADTRVSTARAAFKCVTMSSPDDTRELIAQMKTLVERLDAPKKRDVWERLPTITTFLSTVVLAGLGLLYTNSNERMESERLQQFRDSQMEAQRAQMRIEELKAITSLVPHLASNDPRTQEVARQMMEAVQRTSAVDGATLGRASLFPHLQSAAPAAGAAGGVSGGGGVRAGSAGGGGIVVGGAPLLSASAAPRHSLTALIDEFARVARLPSASNERRTEAVREIGRIAAAPTTPRAVRDRAADQVSQIATAADAPAEVREAAEDVLERLRSVDAGQIAGVVAAQPKTRMIDEVIIHHSATPAAAYRHPTSILSMVRFLINQRGWKDASFHYAVAPDGAIWIGVPLEKKAIHTPRRHETTVSVLLVMNGETELPTEAQRGALTALLRALFGHLGLSPKANFADGRGFHRDHVGGRSTCPGSKMTKELLLSWLGENP